MVVNVFLFDDFEVMDAFGPVQIFGCVPEHFYIRFISLRGGLITGKQGIKVWTEPLNPIEIEDIFLIPGGKGVKSFLHTERDKGQQLLKQAVEEAAFCVMVQNASAMLAKTGLLFHRQVADYGYDENWKRMFTVGINYINGENWISDGKYYSSSTTIAALDMTLGLIGDMLDTMYEKYGVGLAAPQVGVLKQIVVIDVGEGPIVLINPEIIETSGEQTGEEGCLSLPGKWGIVTRPNYVKVRALNEEMEEVELEGEGLLARAFCHEIDHLAGHMYVERVEDGLHDVEPPEEEVE